MTADTPSDRDKAPILELARQIEAVYQAVDRELAVTPVDAATLEELERVDRLGGALIQQIQQQIEVTPATTLDEATIHAMLAAAQVELVRTMLNGECVEQLLVAERLIRSVLKVLIGHLAIDLSEHAGRRYLHDFDALTARQH